jgi:tRNA(fMet)-specific endonuclease VapC
MKFLLDANMIIKVSTGVGEKLLARVAECDEGDMVTSSIAFAEAAYGSLNNKPPPVEQLRAFVEEVPVLSFDYKAALAYATLPFKRASYDLLIAAHALSYDLILVTDNEKQFADVPGLRVENWTV